MTNLLRKIQSYLAKRSRSLMALFVTMGMVFPMAMLSGSNSLAAGTPVFNNMANDYPTLMVANRTTSPDSYGQTANVSVGDRVALRVYIHNTVLDTTANNVLVTASMDSNFSTNHSVSATVSADNASPVSGNITTTSGNDVQLKYVPGTTQRFWFDANSQMQSEVLGDGILSGGVNIGNVNGCWNYVQYVVFQAEVVARPVIEPTLTINKQVMNVTDSTSYSNEVNAEEGDTVRFQMIVTNTSTDTAANNVILVDSLPANLTYLTNTTIRSDVANPNQGLSDGVVANGLNLGSLSAQTGAVGAVYTAMITFDARVNIDQNVRLENIATAVADNADPVSDNAFVNVKANVVEEPNLTIAKTVSKGENSSSWQESVNTEEGDYVRFRIVVGNNGDSTAENVVVTDEMENWLVYQSNSTYVDGDRTSDDIFDEGVDLGDLDPNDTVEIIYTARVNTDREMTLDNEATADADNADPVSDNARVLNNGSNPEEEPFLDLTKSVDQSQVKPGDEIEYTLTLRNTGDGDATQVTITDELPNDIRYISGSIDIELDGDGDVTDEDLFGDGVVIDTMEPNDEVVITYMARVDSDAEEGDRLENVAVATDHEGDRAEDEAAVTVQNDAYLSITKTVDKSRAKAGEELKYILVVENTGDGDATNLIITDELPDYVTYVNGSLDVNGDNVRDYDDQDLFESRGIRVSRLAEGDEIELTFKVKIDSNLNRDVTLDNLAEVRADDGLRDEAIASTFVGMGGDQANLSVVKLVKNETNGGSFVSSNTANPGNILEYKITATNNGNQRLTNVRATDLLPNQINYLGGTIKVWLNGVEVSGDYNNLVSSGISLPDMNAGDVIVISFRTKTDTSISDNTSKTNTATVSSGQVTRSGSATTVFDVIEPQPAPLPKTGPDMAVGGFLFSTFGAIAWYLRERYLLGQMF